MINLVWELPFPSTELIEMPIIQFTGSKKLSILLKFESEDECAKFSVNFNNVKSFKCTYLDAVDVEMIKTSYDKLITLSSDWLSSVNNISQRVSNQPLELYHYRLFLDEGPCYEVICSEVEICSL